MDKNERVTEFERFMEKIGTTNVTLPDTIELMKSGDYKERFVAEYYQLKIRFDSLNTMLIKMKAGTLDFKPTSTEGTLEDQLYYMNEYMKILRIRAEVEGIDLFAKTDNRPEEVPIEEPEEKPEQESEQEIVEDQQPVEEDNEKNDTIGNKGGN